MAERPGPATPAPPHELPDRVRLPLLTLITQQSLDEDYLHAAERRAAGAPRPPSGRPPRTAAVVVAVFGLLAATAFVQTTRNADVDDASRESLIGRIEAQRDRRAAQQERVAALREGNLALEDDVSGLVDVGQEVAVTERRLAVRTGFSAVTGEGVRVVVTEAPDADENNEVHDSDLDLLVNGLWQAGAEAIAVNGQRLTAVTAIRTSGAAIRVNGVGIQAPYTVEAIGDTRTLSARLFDTTTGLKFVSTSQVYGFDYTVEDNVEELSLPSAPDSALVLRSAESGSAGTTKEKEEPLS
ncbi:DUF881 domain-containing protein [Nocardioides dongxiaopingii]|uniref:DUF881 domain-containing protein n=1 Tax=Nocardioides sp. S-1144 TaxID=2582905 RepID=UPI00110E0A28|nr:DUF881 domain-containing protein [Nocardioides sp. S-1144]QCW50779.1 DUF881 domain-containing protein [Nocardioides sp. S-1144]